MTTSHAKQEEEKYFYDSGTGIVAKVAVHQDKHDKAFQHVMFLNKATREILGTCNFYKPIKSILALGNDDLFIISHNDAETIYSLKTNIIIGSFAGTPLIKRLNAKQIVIFEGNAVAYQLKLFNLDNLQKPLYTSPYYMAFDHKLDAYIKGSALQLYPIGSDTFLVNFVGGIVVVKCDPTNPSCQDLVNHSIMITNIEPLDKQSVRVHVLGMAYLDFKQEGESILITSSKTRATQTIHGTPKYPIGLDEKLFTIMPVGVISKNKMTLSGPKPTNVIVSETTPSIQKVSIV